MIFIDVRKLLAVEGAVSEELQARTQRPRLTALAYGVVSLVPTLCFLVVLLEVELLGLGCYRDITHIGRLGAGCAPLVLLANAEYCVSFYPDGVQVFHMSDGTASSGPDLS